jgi:hypothetical protein
MSLKDLKNSKGSEAEEEGELESHSVFGQFTQNDGYQ